MKPRPCVIKFFEPGLGREVTAGKFCWVNLSPRTIIWAYVNNVSMTWDLMEELDAWGVAPCVMQAMEEMGIHTIHYVCKDEGVTYITDLEQVKAKGILASYGGRGRHYHLPRRYWHAAKGEMKYPWVTKEWQLEWTEELEQLEMAL